jgi:hypothetical protein
VKWRRDERTAGCKNTEAASRGLRRDWDETGERGGEAEFDLDGPGVGYSTNAGDHGAWTVLTSALGDGGGLGGGFEGGW